MIQYDGQTFKNEKEVNAYKNLMAMIEGSYSEVDEELQAIEREVMELEGEDSQGDMEDCFVNVTAGSAETEIGYYEDYTETELCF